MYVYILFVWLWVGVESESISDPDWRPLISPRAKEKMDIVALFRNILPLIRHTVGHKICAACM